MLGGGLCTFTLISRCYSVCRKCSSAFESRHSFDPFEPVCCYIYALWAVFHLSRFTAHTASNLDYQLGRLLQLQQDDGIQGGRMGIRGVI